MPEYVLRLSFRPLRADPMPPADVPDGSSGRRERLLFRLFPTPGPAGTAPAALFLLSPAASFRFRPFSRGTARFPPGSAFSALPFMRGKLFPFTTAGCSGTLGTAPKRVFPARFRLPRSAHRTLSGQKEAAELSLRSLFQIPYGHLYSFTIRASMSSVGSPFSRVLFRKYSMIFRRILASSLVTSSRI